MLSALELRRNLQWSELTHKQPIHSSLKNLRFYSIGKTDAGIVFHSLEVRITKEDKSILYEIEENLPRKYYVTISTPSIF